MKKINSMELTEAYSLLGLSFREKVTPQSLSKAYHKVALAVHPDAGPQCDRAEREMAMARVNDARDLVSKMLGAAGRAAGAGINPFGNAVRDDGMMESKFQGDLKRGLTAAGARVFNVHGHGMQESGWPDLQVYSLVWTGQLELKSERGGLSKDQQEVMKSLLARGCMCWLMRVEQGVVTCESVLSGGIVWEWRAGVWKDGGVVLRDLALLGLDRGG